MQAQWYDKSDHLPKFTEFIKSSGRHERVSRILYNVLRAQTICGPMNYDVPPWLPELGYEHCAAGANNVTPHQQPNVGIPKYALVRPLTWGRQYTWWGAAGIRTKSELELWAQVPLQGRQSPLEHPKVDRGFPRRYGGVFYR